MKPEKQNPAPLAGGNRAKETFNSGDPELRPSVYKLQVWSDRLERRIQCLAAMADWRDELQSRIRRAELRFEHVGLDADEQDALAAQVAEFNQVCCGLSAQPSISTAAERRADEGCPSSRSHWRSLHRPRGIRRLRSILAERQEGRGARGHTFSGDRYRARQIPRDATTAPRDNACAMVAAGRLGDASRSSRHRQNSGGNRNSLGGRKRQRLPTVAL